MKPRSGIKIGKDKNIWLLHTFGNRLEHPDKLRKLLENYFAVYSIAI